MFCTLTLRTVGSDWKRQELQLVFYTIQCKHYKSHLYFAEIFKVLLLFFRKFS